MNNMKILALLAAYLTAFGYYGCKKSEPSETRTGFAREDSAVQAAASSGAAGGAYVKNEFYFKLPDCKGGEIDLAAYAGKPVMLMFFTENCPFCRKAAPFIEALNKKYSAGGLRVIGVCLQDEADAAGSFVKDFGLTFPVAYKGGEISRKYRTRGVPYIFILNKAHVVRDVWAGYDPQFDKAIVQGVEKAIK